MRAFSILRLATVPLAAAALAVTAAGQTFLGTVNGQSGSRLGAAAVQIGDYDGDGHRDLLVGAPFHNQGAVRVLSGRYLATGAGLPVLLTVPGPSFGQPPTSEYGASLELVGDWTGDGEEEVAVGAPRYHVNGIGVGGIFVLDGASFVTVGWVAGVFPGDLGHSLARVADLTGDGRVEIASGMPEAGRVYVCKSDGFPSGTLDVMTYYQGPYGYGTSIVSGFDIGGPFLDEEDLLVGSPYEYSGVAEGGVVWWEQADWGPYIGFSFKAYGGTVPGEHLGASLDLLEDLDGDGVPEFLIGAPDWNGGSGKPEGRALVFAGGDILGPSQPPLREYRGGLSGPNLNATGWRFGSAVAACDDLNGDGVRDYMVGMPDYATQLPLGPGKGGGRVYSGATGDLFIGFTGGNNDRLGDTLLSVDDVDGDGFPELVIGGSLSDAGGVDAGRVNLYSPYPAPPRAYCTGKPNSLGCTPAVGWSGTASASSAASFSATCQNVLNNKLGVLFYGFAPAANPFQGGTKCVASPIKRLPAQDSGGSPAGNDCTGTYAVELNGLIQSGGNPALVAGAEVYAQFWSRDPLASFGSSLSNGLRFVINP